MILLPKYQEVYRKNYRDESTVSNNNIIIDFPADKNIVFRSKFKQQITGQTGNNGTKDVEILILLK